MAKTTKKAGKARGSAADRLERAVKASTEDVTVAGRRLTLRKWSLRQGMRLGGKLAKIVQEAVPTGDVADLLHVDLDRVVSANEDTFVDLLVGSVERSFAGDEARARDDAREWVEGLSLEDALELFAAIGRLNLRPLMRRLGEMQTEIVELDGKVRGRKA